jgi:hypothetical protein
MTTPSERTADALARPAASSQVKAEQSNSRWDRWTISTQQHDSVGRRGYWLIASVVAAGMLTWLVATAR